MWKGGGHHLVLIMLLRHASQDTARRVADHLLCPDIPPVPLTGPRADPPPPPPPPRPQRSPTAADQPLAPDPDGPDPALHLPDQHHGGFKKARPLADGDPALAAAGRPPGARGPGRAVRAAARVRAAWVRRPRAGGQEAGRRARAGARRHEAVGRRRVGAQVEGEGRGPAAVAGAKRRRPRVEASALLGACWQGRDTSWLRRIGMQIWWDR